MDKVNDIVDSAVEATSFIGASADSINNFNSTIGQLSDNVNSLVVNPTALALSKGQGEIIAYDSILYGGNNSVELLAEEDLPAKLLLEPGYGKLGNNDRIILLHRELRNGKFSGYII